jgi:hypothetical protein
LLAWLFVTTSAHGEQTTCSARPSSSEWRFPSVVPWRASPPIHASVQVTCQHRGPLERKAAVCLSLGLGSGGKGFDRRQLTDNGAESGTALAIRILGPGSANFGSYYFQQSALSVTMSIGPHAQATQTIPLQLSIVEDQVTAPARNTPYTSDFYPGHTAVAVVHTPAFGSPDCSDRQPDPVNTFSFKVSASIPPFCEFSGGIATMRFPDRRGKDDVRRTAVYPPVKKKPLPGRSSGFFAFFAVSDACGRLTPTAHSRASHRPPDPPACRLPQAAPGQTGCGPGR